MKKYILILLGVAVFYLSSCSGETPGLSGSNTKNMSSTPTSNSSPAENIRPTGQKMQWEPRELEVDSVKNVDYRGMLFDPC